MAMRRCLRALPVVVALLACGCWPAPGGGPNRSAHNSLESRIGVATVPTLYETWQAPGGNFSPIIVGQRVYTADSYLTARDVATGVAAWQRPDVPTFDGAGLFFHDGELLVRSATYLGTSSTTRFDPATGQTLGSSGLPLGRLESIRGSTAAVQSLGDVRDPVLINNLHVAALDDPNDRWFAPLLVEEEPMSPPTPPTLGTDRVFVTGRGLLSTDPTDATTGLSARAYGLAGPPAPCATVGQEYPVTYACPSWATPLAGAQLTAPVLSDDLSTVFIGSDAGIVSALDEATGAVRWSAPVGAAVTATPAVADGAVLVPTAAGEIVALPADGCGSASCSPLWSAPTDGVVTEQPVAAGGVVFTVADGGALVGHAVAGCGAATCGPLWSTSLGGDPTAPMAIASGHLLVTVDRVIHAFTPSG